MSYSVYVLECSDGTFYVGSTTDVLRRVKEHNTSKKAAKYTRARRPVVLHYAEQVATKSKAQQREYVLKQLSHKEKQALIRSIP